MKFLKVVYQFHFERNATGLDGGENPGRGYNFNSGVLSSTAVCPDPSLLRGAGPECESPIRSYWDSPIARKFAERLMICVDPQRSHWGQVPELKCPCDGCGQKLTRDVMSEPVLQRDFLGTPRPIMFVQTYRCKECLGKSGKGSTRWLVTDPAILTQLPVEIRRSIPFLLTRKRFEPNLRNADAKCARVDLVVPGAGRHAVPVVPLASPAPLAGPVMGSSSASAPSSSISEKVCIEHSCAAKSGRHVAPVTCLFHLWFKECVEISASTYGVARLRLPGGERKENMYEAAKRVWPSVRERVMQVGLPLFKQQVASAGDAAAAAAFV